jgi:hypothetical protein
MTDDDTGLRTLYEPVVETAGHQTPIVEYAARFILGFFYSPNTIPYSIVAIHGIGSHPNDTWCKNIGTPEAPSYVNWLKDANMLPSVVPKARIM